MPILRLDRFLSSQGCGTRKDIHDMLRRGNIVVNGKAAARPEIKIDTARDEVRLAGCTVRYREHVYIMMNKPSGIISASDDPREPTVINLLPLDLIRPGLFPAGRLDRDTEGLLIITDDGGFAHEILSPKRHVDKQYYAIIDSPISDEEIKVFENGIVIDGGYVCLPAALKCIENTRTRVLITIHEGKFHQIKRMFAALGKEVMYLKRTAMGGLLLDPSLKPGEVRELNDNEVASIKDHK